MQPVPVVHGAIGVDTGQIVAVGIVDVAVVRVRPAAVGQADVHRPVVRAIKQRIAEQIDIRQTPQREGVGQVDVGGVALVEGALGVATVLGLDDVRQRARHQVVGPVGPLLRVAAAGAGVIGQRHSRHPEAAVQTDVPVVEVDDGEVARIRRLVQADL